MICAGYGILHCFYDLKQLDDANRKCAYSCESSLNRNAKSWVIGVAGVTAMMIPTNVSSRNTDFS